MTVTKDSGPELFRAAQVSIGMFGILTEVTLRVRSKFNLKEIRTRQNLTYCLNNLDSLVQGDHKYVKMWVEFYNDLCVLYQTEETNEAIEPLPWWLGYLTVSYLPHVCHPYHMSVNPTTCMLSLPHVCQSYHMYVIPTTCMSILPHVCYPYHMYVNPTTCMLSLPHVCQSYHMYVIPTTCMSILPHVCYPYHMYVNPTTCMLSLPHVCQSYHGM